VTELRFRALHNIDAEACNGVVFAEDDYKVEVYEQQSAEDPRDWAFALEVTLDNNSGARYPYVFKVALFGSFSVAAEIEPPDSDLIAVRNGPAILYSAAREIVAATTGRGPYPAVLLPAVNFLDRLPPGETLAVGAQPACPVCGATTNKQGGPLNNEWKVSCHIAGLARSGDKRHSKWVHEVAPDADWDTLPRLAQDISNAVTKALRRQSI
jgi:hypothetical protein